MKLHAGNGESGFHATFPAVPCFVADPCVSGSIWRGVSSLACNISNSVCSPVNASRWSLAWLWGDLGSEVQPPSALQWWTERLVALYKLGKKHVYHIFLHRSQLPPPERSPVGPFLISFTFLFFYTTLSWGNWGPNMGPRRSSER